MYSNPAIKPIEKKEDDSGLIVEKSGENFMAYFKETPKYIGIGSDEFEALENLKYLIIERADKIDLSYTEELNRRHRKLWNY